MHIYKSLFYLMIFTRMILSHCNNTLGVSGVIKDRQTVGRGWGCRYKILDKQLREKAVIYVWVSMCMPQYKHAKNNVYVQMFIQTRFKVHLNVVKNITINTFTVNIIVML